MTPFPILSREHCLSWITQLPRHRRVGVDEHHPQRHPGARRHLLVSPRDRDSCRCLFGPSPTISQARNTDCQRRPYPDMPSAHLQVSLRRRGRSPLPGPFRRPPIPTPLSLTESPRSPSRDLLDIIASPRHCLLAGDIKGHPRN